MLQNLTGWHAIIVLAVILLLFGATKLPALARSVGQSMRIFKTEVAESTRAAPENEQTDDTEPARSTMPVPLTPESDRRVA
ncbi:twin-arginine translocase TatA/TatE family subunit [Agromyces atrinae]|uniref:Sec-independent protein translocase protein TatA n=1 Tax=Agromyces atrinae TaxID=592376 RepID=A0A4Q2MB60_9MICO|nr:twin-arginine translocase TatA/TatE family subunit [Agromyces atrinae]MCI2956482.1 twin-arginine translocase TatA/TatE family subunit [Agromyces atrinae]NYD68144.1 sec-independent protein translocase protein TatA [Agromyces atrinae]RXZ87713.1 twin-arginine translocase TatA/TatE family subunit [Agromyces atrinae]